MAEFGNLGEKGDQCMIDHDVRVVEGAIYKGVEQLGVSEADLKRLLELGIKTGNVNIEPVSLTDTRGEIISIVVDKWLDLIQGFAGLAETMSVQDVFEMFSNMVEVKNGTQIIRNLNLKLLSKVDERFVPLHTKVENGDPLTTEENQMLIDAFEDGTVKEIQNQASEGIDSLTI